MTIDRPEFFCDFESFEQLLHALPDALLVVDEAGSIVMTNRQVEKLFGLSEGELLGSTIARLLPTRFQHDHANRLRDYFNHGRSRAMGTSRNLVAQRADGEEFAVDISIQLVRNNGKPYGVAIVRDVSEQRRIQTEFERQSRALARSNAHLWHLAHYDPLTELPNRVLFQDRLAHALLRAKRKQCHAALMNLDLDNFKDINDSMGHGMGDQLLQSVSQRLHHCIREDDSIARLGGDEFTIILEEIQYPHDAAQVARKLIDTLSVPFRLQEREVFVTTSIGIATYPNCGLDAETLFKHADMALYLAKDKGRSNFQFFSADMNARLSQRVELIGELRQALDRKEFELYYQPLIDARSGVVTGFEALLRWNHPRMGIVVPQLFIPLLEETGLIIPVGEWVLETACAQLCRWRQTGLPGIRMSVNLSARQFRQLGLIDRIRAILKESGLDGTALQVELTESLLADTTDDTIERLADLRDIGVRLSLDDFGTGYSSLGYLKNFPLDSLKLDRSFVSEIRPDADGAALVAAMIHLAHSMRLRIVAEGVETNAQMLFLRDQGCEELQGFLFSEPLPHERCEAWWRQTDANHRLIQQ